jgi:prevent-host-death family protein
MTDKTISEVRADFARAVEEVHYTQERVRVTRHGRAFVAIVPVEDLELLEALEDRDDLDAFRKALAEPGENVPYDAFRREILGSR